MIAIIIVVYILSILGCKYSDRQCIKKGEMLFVDKFVFFMPIMNTLLLFIPLISWFEKSKVWSWVTNKDLEK
jgi:C4-dicarboxylate transporter